MNTNKRIKNLWKHYFDMTNWAYDQNPCVLGAFGSNATAILDQLDKCAGINTRWRDGHKCPLDADQWGQWWCAGNHNETNYVGARVALHEQHISGLSFNKTVTTFLETERAPPYFWLGAEAEQWSNYSCSLLKAA